MTISALGLALASVFGNYACYANVAQSRMLGSQLALQMRNLDSEARGDVAAGLRELLGKRPITQADFDEA